MFSREAKNRVEPGGRTKGGKSFRAAWETLLASQSNTEKKASQSRGVRFRRGWSQDADSQDSSDAENYYDKLNSSVHSTNGSINLSGSFSKSTEIEDIWTSSARRLKNGSPSSKVEMKMAPIEGDFQFHAGYPPVQEHLVLKICEGDYMNFQELLPENLEGGNSKGNKQLIDETERIEDITKWVACMSLYIAIYCSTKPQCTKSMLAYLSIITKLSHESQDKKAWQRYDVAFRHKAYLSGLRNWSVVDENLWVFACSRDARKALLCKPCLSVAHDSGSCPLNLRNDAKRKAEMAKKRGLW